MKNWIHQYWSERADNVIKWTFKMNYHFKNDDSHPSVVIEEINNWCSRDRFDSVFAKTLIKTTNQATIVNFQSNDCIVQKWNNENWMKLMKKLMKLQLFNIMTNFVSVFHKWRNIVKFSKEFIFGIIERINMKISNFCHFVIRKQNLMLFWCTTQDCMWLHFLLLRIWKVPVVKHIIHIPCIMLVFRNFTISDYGRASWWRSPPGK